jgi:amidase
MVDRTRIRLGRQHITTAFDRREPPVLRVRPGETIVIETEDSRAGETRTPETTTPAYLRAMRARGWRSNPVTGPIQVEGAAPGDTLLLTIEEIACDTQGYTGTWPIQLHMTDWFSEPETVIWPIADGYIHLIDGIRVPVRPMVGTIGVAPAVEVLSTATSGRHGGNLDIPEVGPGATIWLPVEVPGALFALGDCHARQNDGETRSLEMRAEVTVTVGLHQGRPPGMTWPRIETAEYLITIGCDRPLENALVTAVREMTLWVEVLTGWEKATCLNLIGLVADCRPGQCIPGLTIPYTLRCLMPRHFLERRARPGPPRHTWPSSRAA